MKKRAVTPKKPARKPVQSAEIDAFLNTLKKGGNTLVFLGKISEEVRNKSEFVTMCHVAKRFCEEVVGPLERAAAEAGFKHANIKVLFDFREES